MKKLFIITLFVLGMCNVSVFGMVQEIILTELYSIIPLDDPLDEGRGGRPNPNRFHASIDDNQLSVGADTDAVNEVEFGGENLLWGAATKRTGQQARNALHDECIGIGHNATVYLCALAVDNLGIWLHDTAYIGYGTIYDNFHRDC